MAKQLPLIELGTPLGSAFPELLSAAYPTEKSYYAYTVDINTSHRKGDAIVPRAFLNQDSDPEVPIEKLVREAEVLREVAGFLHAASIMRNQDKFLAYRKYTLLFPGTILELKHGGKVVFLLCYNEDAKEWQWGWHFVGYGVDRRTHLVVELVREKDRVEKPIQKDHK